jgi:DNA-binding response OmpR family regulator
MWVDAAYDGEEALQLVRDNDYDAIILDVMLPKIEGTDVCRQIREFSEVPVLMVTAKDDPMDKIMGLEYGADDYITKPFNILELKARIKAILRRSIRSVSEPRKADRLVLRDIALDVHARRVFVSDKEINLTAREYDLLEFFMNNIGRVFEREELLLRIWGPDNTGDARTVDVHVHRLREKIEKNPSEPKYILTKWGVGYYFR